MSQNTAVYAHPEWRRRETIELAESGVDTVLMLNARSSVQRPVYNLQESEAGNNNIRLSIKEMPNI